METHSTHLITDHVKLWRRMQHAIAIACHHRDIMDKWAAVIEAGTDAFVATIQINVLISQQQRLHLCKPTTMQLVLKLDTSQSICFKFASLFTLLSLFFI